MYYKSKIACLEYFHEVRKQGKITYLLFKPDCVLVFWRLWMQQRWKWTIPKTLDCCYNSVNCWLIVLWIPGIKKGIQNYQSQDPLQLPAVRSHRRWREIDQGLHVNSKDKEETVKTHFAEFTCKLFFSCRSAKICHSWSMCSFVHPADNQNVVKKSFDFYELFLFFALNPRAKSNAWIGCTSHCLGQGSPTSTLLLGEGRPGSKDTITSLNTHLKPMKGGGVIQCWPLFFG
jgi:hypothetical protein